MLWQGIFMPLDSGIYLSTVISHLPSFVKMLMCWSAGPIWESVQLPPKIIPRDCTFWIGNRSVAASGWWREGFCCPWGCTSRVTIPQHLRGDLCSAWALSELTDSTEAWEGPLKQRKLKAYENKWQWHGGNYCICANSVWKPIPPHAAPVEAD